MKISVISPSFNQAQFLPDNLTSVASQTWGDVEHVIVDPGSTDGSTEIARAARDVVLIAEPDRGQSDGITKGFARSTGDVLVWLNSDDFYPSPDVLETVAKCFQDNPDVDVVYGDVNFVDEQGAFLRKGFVNKNAGKLLESFQYQVGIVQPGVFWRRSVFENLGGPSDEFEYCMDYELWVRMASAGLKWHFVPKVLAHHRWWDGMKTSSRRDLSLQEHFRVCDRYFGYVHWKWLDRYADFLCSDQDGVVNHSDTIDPVEKQKTLRHVIDEVVTQEMLRVIAGSDDPERKATWEFIQTHHPEKHRYYFDQSEIDLAERHADDPHAEQRVAWNIFDTTAQDGRKFRSYHVPDNFDRLFDLDWHETQLRRSESKIKQLQQSRRGDTCVVVGNGPSLRQNDLTLLEGVDSIISNFAVMSPELEKYARFFTVVNDLVAKQGALEFNRADKIKIIPFWLANYVNESENTFFVNATVKPAFSTDFVNSASWRSTVSFFNLQLAYAIGYRKVIMIGFDHSYVQPKGMTEGTLINQVEDDENHFDPRYFKGKDWQAADTVNMEKSYVLTKAAFEADGREIVNCTVGGKLELFRRGDLATELGVKAKAKAKLPSKSIPETRPEIRPDGFPKVLIVDSTPVGHGSATGQIKRVFLGDWPQDRVLQVWENQSAKPTLHLFRPGGSIAQSKAAPLSRAEILRRCQDFAPDVIYFRPVDSDGLFDLVTALKRQNPSQNTPLVLHIMDDWQERLRLQDAARHKKMETALQGLVTGAARLLSISDPMSAAFAKRYGGSWQALANGVDPQVFRAKDWDARPPVSPENPFVIRYMGGLAEDMNLASVRDVAEAVAALQDTHAVRFEINTMAWYLDKARADMGKLEGVDVKPLVDDADYIDTLCGSDALLIAYNFDPLSLAYTGLSLANKMPESLVSGVPVLAYGPLQSATISTLDTAGCAQTVTQRNPAQLQSEIRRLIEDRALCRNLGAAGRAYVKAHKTRDRVERSFRDILSGAAATAEGGTAVDTASSRPDFAAPFFAPDISAQGVYEVAPCIRRTPDGGWHFDTRDTARPRWTSVHKVTGPTNGRSYRICLKVQSDKAAKINVSLARHTPENAYEGGHSYADLEPGQPRMICVEAGFSQAYSKLKVQVDLVAGSDVTLEITPQYFVPTASSVFTHLPAAEQTLRNANTRFRKGDYFSALCTYMHLDKTIGLRFYAENGLMAAAKLGWPAHLSKQQLREIIGA